MAVELVSSSFECKFSAALVDLGLSASTCDGQVQSGSTEFPTLLAVMEGNGTGDLEANMAFAAKYTITAGSNQDLDLSGSLSSLVNTTATFSKVKQIVVLIDEPDGDKKVKVGPQGVANGCQLWFGGTGSTCSEEVVEWTVKTNRFDGWTVTPGTGDILRINNPTASSVSVYIVIVGLS